MPPADLRGKVVLLTGAAGGIGAVLEAALLQAGARVVSADLSFARPGADSAPWPAGNPVRLGLEVSDKSGVDALVALSVREWGRLDVVVNAAGILTVKPILEISEQDWDRTFAVNVKGLFFVCQAALRQMMQQRGGCIVNLASVSGKVGGVLAGADYSASKAAVICLTKSLPRSRRGDAALRGRAPLRALRPPRRGLRRRALSGL